MIKSDLHQVRSGDVRNGGVNDPDRVGVDHRRADEKVENDVDTNGVDFARFGMSGRH